MIRYQLTGNGVLDRETGVSIPAAPGSRHYLEYVKWCEDGNTPIPAQPSPYHVLDGNEVWVEDVATKEDAEGQEILKEADKKLPRGVEDLIDTLVSKNIILATDLPQCVQDTLVSKVNARKKLKPS